MCLTVASSMTPTAWKIRPTPFSSPIPTLSVRVNALRKRPKPLTEPSVAWNISPSFVLTLPSAMDAWLPNSRNAADSPSSVAFSPILTRASAKSFITGMSFVPMASLTSPHPFFIRIVESAVAEAVPLTCVSTAVRMTFCASWIRFVWTRIASFAFSDSVKVIPDRRRLLTPLMGSSRAFPSWTALVVASPNPAAAMSTVAWVARSKAAPAMSAVRASWRNVRSLA